MKKVYLNGKYSHLFCMVDDADFELVFKFKWYFKCGYACTVFHKKGYSRLDKDRNQNIAMHRLLLGFPDGVLDHINGNRLDNRRQNLRIVNWQQNASNSMGSSNRKYTYKGVCKDGNKWIVWVTSKGNSYFLGSFDSELEAALVYDKGARYFFGEYARLNFPEKFYDKPVRCVDFIPDKIIRKSKYIGVSYFGHGGKRKKRWRAVFRKKTLGYFMTEKEAGLAYQKAKEEYESKKSIPC